jgi:hypothetical protein
MWTRICFNANPEPELLLDADPEADPDTGNIQHFKDEIFSLLRVIFTSLDPDPDTADQNECGSGSTKVFFFLCTFVTFLIQDFKIIGGFPLLSSASHRQMLNEKLKGILLSKAYKSFIIIFLTSQRKIQFTFPSSIMPMPILLALPSNPMITTI